MRVLALEPYFGGSHKAFLDGWQDASVHTWTVIGLPPRKWKWRMRHAAVTLSDQLAAAPLVDQRWDVLFCSTMLNLAEFRGLAPRHIRDLPTVAYFHENQLTYPNRVEKERDLHFGLTNITSALAADECWFNSAFNRDSFLEAIPQTLKRMPDYRLTDAAERIRAKSRVWPQGVHPIASRARCDSGLIHLLWAARWEHDKNPQAFFDCLEILQVQGVPFRASVIGERFRETPPIFDEVRPRLAPHIAYWGYQPSRRAYEDVLRQADVVISTADHEFFGVSVVEAVSAGAFPLLPRRLAYPEIFDDGAVSDAGDFFYDNSVSDLARRLKELIGRHDAGDLWGGDPDRARRAVERYFWPNLAPALDRALAAVAGAFRGREELPP